MLGRLVSDGELRSSLLDELHELSAFLRSRASELTSSSSSFLADTPNALQDLSAGTVNGWLQVRSPLRLFCNRQVEKCCMLNYNLDFIKYRIRVSTIDRSWRVQSAR